MTTASSICPFCGTNSDYQTGCCRRAELWDEMVEHLHEIIEGRQLPDGFWDRHHDLLRRCSGKE